MMFPGDSNSVQLNPAPQDDLAEAKATECCNAIKLFYAHLRKNMPGNILGEILLALDFTAHPNGFKGENRMMGVWRKAIF